MGAIRKGTIVVKMDISGVTYEFMVKYKGKWQIKTLCGVMVRAIDKIENKEAVKAAERIVRYGPN